MTMTTKEIALQNFRQAWSAVMKGGDYPFESLRWTLDAAGGAEALGIDKKQVDALDRQGGKNSAQRCLRALKSIDPAKQEVFDNYMGHFLSALKRAGGYEAAGIRPEEVHSLRKTLRPRTPSVCGDE